MFANRHTDRPNAFDLGGGGANAYPDKLQFRKLVNLILQGSKAWHFQVFKTQHSVSRD